MLTPIHLVLRDSMDSRYDRQRDGRRRRFDDRSDDRFFDDRFRDGHPQPPPPRRRHFDIHSTYSDDDGDYHRGHRDHASSWRSEGGSRRRSSNPWDGHDASRFFRGSGRGHSTRKSLFSQTKNQEFFQ